MAQSTADTVAGDAQTWVKTVAKAAQASGDAMAGDAVDWFSSVAPAAQAFSDAVADDSVALISSSTSAFLSFSQAAGSSLAGGSTGSTGTNAAPPAPAALVTKGVSTSETSQYGDKWFNDGPGDSWNPLAYVASVGDSIGTRIGDAYGVLASNSTATTLNLVQVRQERAFNAISDPDSRMTVSQAQQERLGALAYGLSEIGGDGVKLADGVVATAELYGNVKAIVGVGTTARQLLNCFPAGTPVATLDGPQAIESVVAGQKVWAYDLISSRWQPCLVTETFRNHYVGNSASLTIAGETVTSTLLHPYWVVRGEGLDDRPRRDHLAAVPVGATTPGRWVDAGDVVVGDELLLRDGRVVAVESIHHEPFEDTVYNFEVENLHCYAVGGINVLVHNSNARETVIQVFEQTAKHGPGGFGSPSLFADNAVGTRAVQQSVLIKTGLRAIKLSTGEVAIFRSASKVPGAVGSNVWHGGWAASAEELRALGKALRNLPVFGG